MMIRGFSSQYMRCKDLRARCAHTPGTPPLGPAEPCLADTLPGAWPYRTTLLALKSGT
jgi:hypothetical protein